MARKYDLGALRLERPLVFLDTETTGADHSSDRIVQIALVKLHPDGHAEELDCLVNPGVHIPMEATAVHGITDEQVKGAKTFAELAEEIIWFCQTHDLFALPCDLAGYNLIRFDLPLLEAEFKRARSQPAFRDSKMSWSLQGRRIIDSQVIFHQMEPRDLSAAVRFYCQRELEGAHGALADTRASLEVLLGQVQRYPQRDPDFPRDLDGLHARSNLPDPQFFDRTRRFRRRDGQPVFAFGVHRGKTLREVAEREPAYLDWLLSQEFSEEVRELVRGVLSELAAGRSGPGSSSKSSPN